MLVVIDDGHCPQCLLYLLLVSARNADPGAPPEVLQGIIDESVRAEGMLEHELLREKGCSFGLDIGHVDGSDCV